MQKAQRFFEHGIQNVERGIFRAGVGAVEPRFRQLNVPVAKFKPDKIVNEPRRLAEFELVKIFGDGFSGAVEPRNNPAVGKFQILSGGLETGVEILKIHEQET